MFVPRIVEKTTGRDKASREVVRLLQCMSFFSSMVCANRGTCTTSRVSIIFFILLYLHGSIAPRIRQCPSMPLHQWLLGLLADQ
jgi:hypothetical protein